MNVDSRYKYTCMGGKRSVMSLPVIQPTTTTIGKTKRAICTDEPNATFNIYIYINENKEVPFERINNTEKNVWSIYLLIYILMIAN